ncbi:MAG: hypothetical protein SGJ02_07750 [bacterium]|nr:hypothetical protein [bacterium]
MKCIINFLILFILVPSLYAEGLNELIGSEEYKNFDRATRRATVIKEGYNLNQSEYIDLFSKGKSGVKQILNWLGSGSGEFKKLKNEAEINKGFIVAKQNFLILGTPEEDVIYLTVLIPKPVSVVASSWGLFQEFIELEPPALEIDSKEDIEIDSFQGQIYFHRKEGACSLLLKLSKGTFFNLFTKTCANREHLISLSKSLDIARLNQKINS